MECDEVVMVKYLPLTPLWAEYHFQLIVDVTALMIGENW